MDYVGLVRLKEMEYNGMLGKLKALLLLLSLREGYKSQGASFGARI